jgi:hypothetical protein
LTVPSAIFSSRAISLLANPVLARARTSSSRGVNVLQFKIPYHRTAGSDFLALAAALFIGENLQSEVLCCNVSLSSTLLAPSRKWVQQSRHNVSRGHLSVISVTYLSIKIIINSPSSNLGEEIHY